MSCGALDEKLTDLIDGRLPAGEAEAARAHLAACSECAAEHALHERALRAVAGLPRLAAPETLPRDLASRLGGPAPAAARPIGPSRGMRSALAAGLVGLLLCSGALLLVSDLGRQQPDPRGSVVAPEQPAPVAQRRPPEQKDRNAGELALKVSKEAEEERRKAYESTPPRVMQVERKPEAPRSSKADDALRDKEKALALRQQKQRAGDAEQDEADKSANRRGRRAAKEEKLGQPGQAGGGAGGRMDEKQAKTPGKGGQGFAGKTQDAGSPALRKLGRAEQQTALARGERVMLLSSGQPQQLERLIQLTLAQMGVRPAAPAGDRRESASSMSYRQPLHPIQLEGLTAAQLARIQQVVTGLQAREQRGELLGLLVQAEKIDRLQRRAAPSGNKHGGRAGAQPQEARPGPAAGASSRSGEGSKDGSPSTRAKKQKSERPANAAKPAKKNEKQTPQAPVLYRLRIVIRPSVAQGEKKK